MKIDLVSNINVGYITNKLLKLKSKNNVVKLIKIKLKHLN